jgi:DNA-directed RNA polymerase subunit E'/Rpb7
MFRSVRLQRTVRVRVTEVGSNVEEILLQRSRDACEGVCGTDGYVRKGSVFLLSHSHGFLDHSSMGSYAVYEVLLSADVCHPVAGDCFETVVRSVNSFGAVAEAGLVQDGTLVPVVEVVLVRRSTADNEREVALLRPGDTVAVQVIGCSYDTGDSVVSAYGRTLVKMPDPPVALDSGPGGAVDIAGPDIAVVEDDHSRVQDNGDDTENDTGTDTDDNNENEDNDKNEEDYEYEDEDDAHGGLAGDRDSGDESP